MAMLYKAQTIKVGLNKFSTAADKKPMAPMPLGGV
jgi:hypothetical protein